MMRQQGETKSLVMAIAVVILCMAAIVSFFMLGGGTIFYLIAIVAILFGIYMAFTISKEGPARRTVARAPLQTSKSRMRGGKRRQK